MKKKLSELIKDPELEKLELELKRPNIFSVLKLESMEIRHSNFLGWLLDPKGSHNLGDIFLRWFLKDIFALGKSENIDEFEIDGYNFSNLKVYRELHNIDILLVSDKFVVAIENKVYSKEHSNQLTKYRKIIEKKYKEYEKIFVYLTPYGDSPNNEIDSKIYCSYSYEEIRKNIVTILEIYSSSISDRCKIYLEDYINVLGRVIMKDDKSIELANQIYLNHKEALDFIFDNRVDKQTQINEAAKRAIQLEGMVAASMNKAIMRFLTPKLDEVIPRSGNGWKNKESFLFELKLSGNNILFQTVISPGDETIRDVLTEILNKLDIANRNYANIWRVHFINKSHEDMYNESLSDEDLVNIFRKIIRENKSIIDKVEKSILENKNKLIHQ
ncbi:PD-(D/E)XK nuclease family protein [Paraclostridium bifermentans]|uniref:PDDEXK-like family protein n=1 Tax=Paraclostridium bifermentans TaxID=1490 RepID=UPI001F23C5B7|nr:PD-(D/E)XK nuclease family protein [Paraclostridium bifermentans]MCE9674393.1 PD-(D/E)XK nuclease family protein [Paraclostridium bifermentans]